jgi:hypothetical protein
MKQVFSFVELPVFNVSLEKGFHKVSYLEWLV